MTIKVLDEKVIAHIAAGEVVERPASVVKELVENALDAGATQLSVEVRGGGISLIRVIDNGGGIPAGEVELAFQRHATSKVRSLEDLESIGTLGFRGEALPSIAAVAAVEIVTCADGESGGTCLTLARGVVTERKGQGRATGTTVTVRNLFREVPARLKFLKSTATEAAHIANVVTQYALARPEVKFTLLSEGRATLRTPGSGRLIDAMAAVYGVEAAPHLLEISGDGPAWGERPSEVAVSGLAGAPTVSRTSRDYLSFFVNRRWVNSRMLARAVADAYAGLLQVGKHPIAVVNIALPPGEVDVNAHPTKLEVKFHHEHAVFAAVQRSVRQCLIKQMPVPRIESTGPVYHISQAQPGLAPPGAPGAGLWSGQSVTARLPFIAQGAPGAAAAVPDRTPGVGLPVLRLLGQFLSRYIVAEGSDGLYLIDQHAAHERVMFERSLAELTAGTPSVQGLLEAATIELTPQQSAVLRSRESDLLAAGFAVEPFGERTWRVRTVPGALHRREWPAALRDLLDSEATDGAHWRERVAASIACHSAVRAGQLLSEDEMRALVRQLEQCASPRSCPHGRPTVLQLSLGQMEREFGRE